MAELVVLTNSNLFPFLMAETVMILSSALKYVWQLYAGLYMHQKVCAVGTEVDSIQLYCGKKVVQKPNLCSTVCRWNSTKLHDAMLDSLLTL